METKDLQNLIQWYPGHMAKAMRNIKENGNICDLFIVVLDARSPISTYNEDFDSISPQKPRLFIITKEDMMDSSKKELINKRFGTENVLWTDLRKKSSKKIILNKINKIMKPMVDKKKEKGFLNPKIKVMVVGVPNAGKSTLINLMTNQNNLKVADYPGVTTVVKWVAVDNFYFMDTPGILMPKIDDLEVAIKLSVIDSIKNSIFPIDLISYAGYCLVSRYYPNIIRDLGVEPSEERVFVYSQFFKLAQIKKFLTKDGKPDELRTQKWFLQFLKNLRGVTYD